MNSTKPAFNGLFTTAAIAAAAVAAVLAWLFLHGGPCIVH